MNINIVSILVTCISLILEFLKPIYSQKDIEQYEIIPSWKEILVVLRIVINDNSKSSHQIRPIVSHQSPLNKKESN